MVPLGEQLPHRVRCRRICSRTNCSPVAADSLTNPARMLDNNRINPIFEATVQATQEAILNAMLAAETMTGADGVRVHALPHDRLQAAMRKYGR